VFPFPPSGAKAWSANHGCRVPKPLTCLRVEHDARAQLPPLPAIVHISSAHGPILSTLDHWVVHPSPSHLRLGMKALRSELRALGPFSVIAVPPALRPTQCAPNARPRSLDYP